MMIFLTILVIFLIIGGAVAGGIYFYIRQVSREQKNYERGLKMVPLLIHLPPQSDDTDVNGRDKRDVTDETISKAQIIYNIIGSTLQKGFKSKFYGQRHFGLEIVGSQGFVYFYASVPVTMVDVVGQAIVSAYPAARLEEVAEHNIFSQVGKINATIGGELTLKETYAYPIATYQDLKRDAMQSVLNSLATLDKEDGAGIQILLRPADPSWRKKASALASKKRKGDDKKSGMAHFGKQLLMAPLRPPEEKKEGGGDKKELSNLEQSTLDAIDDKTRHQGYEVLIRLVASSNVSQRSQAILRNMVASFSLFDAPGRNGFKFTPTKDIDSFVTSYIMRFFPQKHTSNILNSVELATLFHFPDQKDMPTSQVTRQESKQVDGPRNVPDDGILLGYNMFRGVKKPIRIGLEDRQRHIYVVGQTGTGKSTLLENLAFQDMVNGNGFAFVDPHGDTAEKLLLMIPRERTEDVIYFSPADMEYPMGLNLFEYQNADQKDFLIQETLNMLYKLYDPQHQGIMGPRYEHLFRNAALTVMADPAGGTFVDIPKLFRDPKFVQQKLQYVKDLNVQEFWQKEMPQSQRSNEFGEVVSWFVSKFGAFLSNEMMRNIIGQTKSAFDLRNIMDNKKILLVNLSKGRLGDMNAKLLGMIFVMKFQAAAMSRANVPEEERIDFSLYVDEFQNFSTDSFATIMSEARKYHLNLIVGNQFTTQLTPEIRDAVFGNIGTIISFRIGQNDVESIGKYFQPTFDSDDLLRIPNRNTIIRTLINGVPTQPFSMATLPPFGNPNPKLGEALKQLSAAKYGRPRAGVEAEIFERMTTKPDPKPAFSASGGGGTPFGSAAPGSPWQAPPASPIFGASAAPTTSALAPKPAASSSFLDDWLTKRQTTSGQPATMPQSKPVMNTAPPAATAWSNQPPAAQPAFDTAPPANSETSAAVSPAETPSVTDLLAASSSTPELPDDITEATEAAALSEQPQSASIASTEAPVTDLSADSETTAIEPPAVINTEDTSFQPSQNISSDETEQNEIDKIAKELKQHLASTTGPLDNQNPPSTRDHGELTPDDTIIIDRDGNLQQKTDTPQKADA